MRLGNQEGCSHCFPGCDGHEHYKYNSDQDSEQTIDRHFMLLWPGEIALFPRAGLLMLSL